MRKSMSPSICALVTVGLLQQGVSRGTASQAQAATSAWQHARMKPVCATTEPPSAAGRATVLPRCCSNMWQAMWADGRQRRQQRRRLRLPCLTGSTAH